MTSRIIEAIQNAEKVLRGVGAKPKRNRNVYFDGHRFWLLGGATPVLLVVSPEARYHIVEAAEIVDDNRDPEEYSFSAQMPLLSATCALERHFGCFLEHLSFLAYQEARGNADGSRC